MPLIKQCYNIPNLSCGAYSEEKWGFVLSGSLNVNVNDSKITPLTFERLIWSTDDKNKLVGLYV